MKTIKTIKNIIKEIVVIHLKNNKNNLKFNFRGTLKAFSLYLPL